MEIIHAGLIYTFNDLAQFVADSLASGHCAIPGAVKKVAKALNLKPRQVQEALDAAGVLRQLTDAEMIGRVSHTGETFVRFHRRSIDSKGSYGHVYEVSYPNDTEKHYDFVHDIDRTSKWHYLPDTPEAAQAQADYLERKRLCAIADKRDEEYTAKVVKVLEGMPPSIELQVHFRGMVVLRGVRHKDEVYAEIQRRLDGIAVLSEPNEFVGCHARFV